MLAILLPLLLLVIGYFIWTVYKNINSNMPEFTYTGWNHYFPGIEFSAKEFYTTIQKNVEDRKIPGAIVLLVDFSEYGSVMDTYRTYLRIRNRRFVFDICAAPYGEGFFVSSWMGEDVTLITRLLFYIPFFGSYLRNRVFGNTYYAWDSQDMFEVTTHLAVMQAIDAMTTQKGIRMLTEAEKTSRRPRKQS